jgi:hypothetical protein
MRLRAPPHRMPQNRGMGVVMARWVLFRRGHHNRTRGVGSARKTGVGGFGKGLLNRETRNDRKSIPRASTVTRNMERGSAAPDGCRVGRDDDNTAKSESWGWDEKCKNCAAKSSYYLMTEVGSVATKLVIFERSSGPET